MRKWSWNNRLRGDDKQNVFNVATNQRNERNQVTVICQSWQDHTRRTTEYCFMPHTWCRGFKIANREAQSRQSVHLKWKTTERKCQSVSVIRLWNTPVWQSYGGGMMLYPIQSCRFALFGLFSISQSASHFCVHARTRTYTHTHTHTHAHTHTYTQTNTSCPNSTLNLACVGRETI